MGVSELIAFIILLAADIAALLLITVDIVPALLCSALIPLVIFILNFTELKILKTVPLKNTSYLSYVTGALESVKKQAEAKGIKFNRKINVYISGSPGLHSYTVGNSIVITKELLKSGRGILEASLAHELSYIKGRKSYLVSLIKINIFAVLFALIVSMAGAVAIFAFILIVALSMVSYFIVALRISGLITDLLRKIIKFISVTFYYITQALLSALCRSMVYKADKFACSLDYGNYLLQLLNEQNKQQRRYTSFSDDIISPKPDNFKRILRIQNYLQVSGKPQKNAYQNPF